jgi:ubiquinone/menaquinone biosynthesis C-methylase UbiE
MQVAGETDLQARIESERKRIRDEYDRREKEINPSLYGEDNPVETWFIEERQLVAHGLLSEFGLKPDVSWKALEIGIGSRGWLPVLLDWGLAEENISGIDIGEARVVSAQKRFPKADLRIGDATRLPWLGESFDLVIASTVLSSVLDAEVRRAICNDMVRVVKRGGAIVWYDMRVGNPRNSNVRGIGENEIRELFGALEYRFQAVTLVPPLARSVFPIFPVFCHLASKVDFLKNHILGVFRKKT